MGVVNVTPDSFSDGGRYLSVEAAVECGLRLLDEGADWLDVGGESTRPGAPPVPAEIEARRVVPVIEALARIAPASVLSVDTSKATVAQRAIAAGATVVNDVSALGDPAMGALCAKAGVQLVVMHMRGTPRTMQADTRYSDLVSDVEAHLASAAQRAITAGVPAHRLVVDPGLGFGKALADNTALIRAVPRFCGLGYRVLIGASRKRFIGAITHEEAPERRVMGSVGAALAAAAGGASIVRVHDVRATIQALEVFWACKP